MKHAYSHPKRQEADEQLHCQQHSTGSGPSAAAGSILPTQQQLHEIYEENLRLREEVVKTSTAGGGGPASAEAAAARNQVCQKKIKIVASALKSCMKFVINS